jgi:hypothetical protein
MRKNTFLGSLIGLSLLTVGPLAYADNPPPQPARFPTEQQAKSYCPDDTIVWLNNKTGIYHYQGAKYYGSGKVGAYVCQREADRAGDRPSPNGR